MHPKPQLQSPLPTALIPAVSVALVLVHIAVLWTMAPSFFRLNNLSNVLIQASTLGILAIGMSFVMIDGGIDLSMPAVMALSAILGTIYMLETQGILVGLLIDVLRQSTEIQRRS